MCYFLYNHLFKFMGLLPRAPRYYLYISQGLETIAVEAGYNATVLNAATVV